MKTRRKEPIAIVGSACRFPGDATSPSKLWELLKNPRDLSADMLRFNPRGFYNKDGHYHGATNATAGYSLGDDPMQFDAAFFNIPPAEAEAMDPQHRLLLETTYEGLEGAGIPAESLRGSDTAAFVGVMSADYTAMVFFDSECTPPYAATGTSRAVLSNRISHAFDWHGASMTVDTACSSSLVAIHLAVQELRTGSSRVALAGGTNLILSADPFIAETSLNMLSPNGRCHMWDARADGYARGEGVAVVVLKTLRDALADGNRIECIIRETGINQDGNTPGITMPNARAQTSLIRDVYMRAGLDLENEADRCQYFEAHGTGTKAGDAVESRAIHDAFFSGSSNANKQQQQQQQQQQSSLPPIFVGSVKTVIGHTEGTAGLAGVLRASLALQNGLVPPNLHFQSLNPEIEPYYGNLQIVTKARPWPTVPHGGVRRASVNSFGFGGANSHVILEVYTPSEQQDVSAATRVMSTSARKEAANALPLLFSASSDKTLLALLQRYMDYLRDHPHTDMRDLAWTLFSSRSALSIRVAVPGPTPERLAANLSSILEHQATGSNSPFIRMSSGPRRLLGVFTGQGAQWPAMGRALIKASKDVEETVDRLEQVLQKLPSHHRPTWSLKEQLLAGKETSRITESALSQPLCTVVQVILVDLIRSAGLDFAAVVGHSSGEISAAYAAGFIGAEDAVKIAYYRGFFAHLSQGRQGEKGGMIAAGMTHEDAKDLCDNPAVLGRISVAAYNSPTSVTISGDSDVIDQVSLVLNDEDKFNRVLRVETAYHSHHMEPCAEKYREALTACAINVSYTPGNNCRWYSSVHGNQEMVATSNLASDYWVDNMVKPVRFSEAVASACQGLQPNAPNMVIEVGPHPALKAPVLDTLKSLGAKTTKLAYSGTLQRGTDDVDAMAGMIGNVWSAFGPGGLKLDEYASRFSQGHLSRISDIPHYPWDHSRSYEFESRESRAHRFRDTPSHPLLGARTNTSGEKEYRWKNYLSTEEIPWLTGHRIQGQTLVPAAMFLVMAVEASKIVATLSGFEVRLLELHDSIVHRALALDEDRTVETLFYLSNITITEGTKGESLFSANYSCDVAGPKSMNRLTTTASGKVKMILGSQSANLLALPKIDVNSLDDIDVETFYKNLATIGYNYTNMFQGIASLKRSTNRAVGTISKTTAADEKLSSYSASLHPATLDVSFQAVFAALSYPGDGRLRALHVPTTIKRLVVNPAAFADLTSQNFHFKASSYVIDTKSICGDIEVSIGDAEHAAFRVDGLIVSPVSPPTADDDKQMFADMALCPAFPNVGSIRSSLGRQSGSNTLVERHDVKAHTIKGLDAEMTAAELLKQISDRYPKIKVLERTTQPKNHVLDAFTALDGKFSSYTFDGMTEEEFQTVSGERSDGFRLKRSTIDFSESYQDARIDGLFDVILWRSGVSMTKETLQHLRHRLKPGGYLIVIAQDSENSGIDGTGSISRPWNEVLRKAGFSGIETEQRSRTGHASVFVAMAVNAAIKMLRRPLQSSIFQKENLLLIGGRFPKTLDMMRELQALVAPFYKNITTVEDLMQLDTSMLARNPTVLNLADLDSDLYRNISKNGLKKLQELTARSERLVWVVSGAVSRNPYANMIKGTLRCLTEECSHLRSQVLDIEDNVADSITFIAESLLRFDAFLSVDNPQEMLWINEPEITLRDGRQLVSRYLPNKQLDLGYNALQRQVEVQVLPKTELLQASVTDDAAIALHRLREMPRPTFLSAQETSKMSEITVRASSSRCVFVSGLGGYLYIVTGRDSETKKAVVTLSAENRSRVSVSKKTVVPLPTSWKSREHELVGWLQDLFQVSSIVARCQRYSSALVHEAPDVLAQLLAVDTSAKQLGVRFIFTTCDSDRAKRRGWAWIDRHGSDRQLHGAVQPDTFTIVDCGDGKTTLSLNDIGMEMPPCVLSRVHAYELVRDNSLHNPMVEDEIIREVLQVAVDKADSLEAPAAALRLTDENDVISIQDLPLLRQASQSPARVISWTSSLPVRATVLPALEEVRFSPDKTYFLVGMAGSLGLSTVSYMISRGARHFALSSRNPQVDPAWIESRRAKYGAIIKTFALDITNKAAVQETISAIKASMPPIGGVANGALIMEDSLFMKLEFEQLSRCLAPKVDGSRYLDEAFSHDNLDFFILYSSLVYVAGNTGQLPYAVANSFMVSLAHQRRQRGLAASVINLTGVSGIGFITRTGHNIQERSKALGYVIISDQDYQYIFAEAVLASASRSRYGPEVSSSLRYVDLVKDKEMPPWAPDAKFGHYLLDQGGAVQSAGASGDEEKNGGGGMSLTEMQAASLPELFDIILQGFQFMVRKLLRLPAAQQISPDSSVLDLGVDSLVAVKMRQWFLNELNVNVSVMKIIGGATISEVIWSVANELRPTVAITA